MNVAKTRGHAQASLGLSYERNLYRDLVASLPAGVYRLRVTAAREWVDHEWVARLATNYTIEMASNAFCRILGVTQAQRKANAQIVAERIHPEDRADFIASNVVSMNGLTPFRWEGRILKGREVRCVNFISVPRLLENGDVLWTGILQDITERRLAAEALRESEKRYRSLFEQAGDAIVVFDQATTTMLDFNEAACRRMGYTRGEFAKLKLSDFEAAETVAQIKRHVQRIVKRGEHVFESRLRTKSGDVLDVEIRPRAITIGGKTLVQAVWRDITDRKRVDALLRKSRDDLEAKVRERTEMLRTLTVELTQAEHRERQRIAHVLHEDLQQRLVGIQFKLHALTEEVTGTSISRVAQQAMNELAETIQLARELATTISPQVLSVMGFRPALVWLSQEMQEKNGLEVKVNGCRSFKLATDGLQGFAFDAIRELLLNVCKHAGVGSAEIRIKAAGRHRLAIEVRDQGKGGAGIRDNRSSFGLLSIRERAHALGAGFAIESQPGQGTCVALTLPTV